MAERRYGKATAVITAFWLVTSAAVLTLATADDAAQAGCGGGSSSGSPSASSSSGGGGGGLPTGATTILPIPGGSSSGGSGSASPSRSPSRSASGSAADDGIPVAQQQSCKSTITIAFESGKAPKFTGKVGSPAAECKRARDVTVKKIKRGPDQRIGKAVTNARGKYTVPARNGKGRFYATVAKSTAEDRNGTTINCQAAKSRAIRP